MIWKEKQFNTECLRSVSFIADQCRVLNWLRYAQLENTRWRSEKAREKWRGWFAYSFFINESFGLFIIILYKMYLVHRQYYCNYL